MKRLTARTETGHAYLVNVKPDEQEVDSPRKNTFQCILDCFERLAAYEDAEEQGRLVVLPCKVGENCFVVSHTDKTITEITVSEFSYSVWHDAWVVAAANGGQFFLANAHRTRAEAEAALEVCFMSNEIEKAIEHFHYGVTHDIFSEPVTTYARLAVDALREQAERSKGCVSCDGGFGDNTVEFKKLGYTTCPCCGKRLEVEP